MRIQAVIFGVSASVLVVAMGAIAAIASFLPHSGAAGSDARTVPVALATRPLDRACRDCAVVVAVRQIALKGKSATMRYQIQVRMSDGSVKTLTSSTEPGWKAGDRVRLQNGRLAG